MTDTIVRGPVRVRRRPDGYPEPDCPVFAACEAVLEALVPLDARTQEALIPGILQDFAKARFWEGFIPLAWPHLALAPFAPFHREAWRWWSAIEEGMAPPALVACWPRGGGKSSTAAMMLALTCLTGLRPYCLWIGAREKAITDKVSGVGALLAAPRVREAFPEQTSPYHDPMTGVKVDWRQGRVATASGFALDAVGMDQALRGALRLQTRPGLLLLDDIEQTTNTPYIRSRIADQVTRAIIPAQSDDAALAWVQNRLHDASLMAAMLDGKLDWFRRRIVSGPWPQIEGLEVELEETELGPQYVIVAGTPTWEGADLAVSEKQINDEGLLSFNAEKQHRAGAAEGDLFLRTMWRRADAYPAGLKVCRAWDLAGSTAASADYTVGVLLGLAADGRVWVLDVARGQWATDEVEERVADLAESDRTEFGRYTVVIEDQPGAAGKMWARRWVRHVLAGFSVELVPPQGSKVWRADALSSTQRKGLCTLVEGPWVQPWVSEFALFQYKDGKAVHRHDDQVDAASLGFNYLTGKGRKSRAGVAQAAGRLIG
jgi:predicted phage terminase large subunit-like protein